MATKDKQPSSRKKLVVVESPSKANTIKKYLGKDYEVLSSVGHVIDLPKSRMGVDLETFEPEYIVMRDKSRVIKELRQAAKNAEAIYLASDPDREGEAIAWHIKNDLTKNVLQKYNLSIPIQRVKFNEITKNEIEEKIKSPEDINEKLVQAQQGRRVIDRIFGYQLSPLLWKKVKSGLSAGRVQSVALRLICEREEEIKNFVPLEYWSIIGIFENEEGNKFKSKV
ncbi:MAG: DNA topoisomerase, partial [Brevinematales bacterium]